ncbi:four-carbon acid sugar kinase family protein [Brachybacterium vulturis]|uniref:four-carbon acid sugar kinase family protein n=1 Tax=Brachybacterium vulturis TaxID=2017484 RepID=UPI003735E642
MHEPSARRLLVLDDDPTGSQCVDDIAVAFDEDPAIPVEVLAEPGTACFVLTNSRALAEEAATKLNRRIVAGVLTGGIPTEGLHVVSRSDSTLRGHVIAEPVAIAEELAAHGVEVDAFVLCPAMIEAGRFTKGDIHYAMVDGQAVQVAETDFARDATFGYSHSDLREFLAERSGGTLDAAGILSISLEDIRSGGRDRVREILSGARERTWVVVNATEYSDLELVSTAMVELEGEGRTFVTRCAPSFVRSLTGRSGARVIDADAIVIPEGRLDHGLVVVGSHVGLTTTQLRAVQERGTLAEVEIDVPSLLDDRREQHLTEIVGTLRDNLTRSDCVLFTSRDLVRTDDPAESLAIARSVSDAVVEIVRRVRTARPAWVVAKGGITSHEVAAGGLGIRRAQVVGQFWPGQVSLFSAQEAPIEVMGMPYVVFPGNVGGAQALADVVDTLNHAAR